MAKVRLTCPSGCGEQEFDPRSLTLVKAFGQPVRVSFVCPRCELVQAKDVASMMIGPICTMFREAGNPLIQLPPQGDLPWPPLGYDDLLDFSLHFDDEMDALRGDP